MVVLVLVFEKKKTEKQKNREKRRNKRERKRERERETKSEVKKRRVAERKKERNVFVTKSLLYLDRFRLFGSTCGTLVFNLIPTIKQLALCEESEKDNKIENSKYRIGSIG